MRWHCNHRSKRPKERRECGHCTVTKEMVNIYTCEIHGVCTIHAKAIRTDGPSSPLVAVCISCPERPVDGT